MVTEELSSKPDLPVRVIQFGGGVFMRGFIDWMINRMNLQLEDDFAAWLENANIFADTLVDRIVAPPSEAEKPEIVKNLPFEDHLLDGSEPYHRQTASSAYQLLPKIR